MPTTSRIAAVLILAMTMAATTAASAVTEALVLAGLGVPDNQRLLNIEPLKNLPGRGPVVFFDSFPNYVRLRDMHAPPFTAVTCTYQSVLSWDDHGDIRPLQAALVSASFFPTVGVTLQVGQPFTEADDGPTPTPVVVISHRVWMEAFAGDPHAIGQSIRLAGTPRTVVGVMPAGFGLPAPTDVWVPLGIPTFIAPTGRVFGVYARLRPEMSIAAATAVMADLTTRAAAEDAVSNRDYRYRARPLREALLDDAGQSVWLLQGGATLLFVLAMSNVWSLFLSWVFERQHETAVRRALGASLRDLVRLYLGASARIAVPAGLVGIAMAWSVLPLVRQLHPSPQLGFLLADAHLDGRTLLASCGLIVVAILAIGIVPAWHASRVDAAAGLNAASRGATLSRSAARWQRGMVLVQAGLTVVVLFGAVVTGVSFWELAAVPDGFDPNGRLVVRATLPDAKYNTHDRRVEFARRLTDEVSREPAIGAFAFTTTLPVGDVPWGGRFFPEAPNGEPAREPMQFHFRRISPGYLQAMGIPLLRGREFDAHDVVDAAPVAIVSRAAAERLWSGEDPIGKRLRRLVTGSTPPPPPIEVVGLAGNTMDGGYTAPAGEAVYLPYAQMSLTRMSMVVRPRATNTDEAAIAAVRRALKAVDPTIAATDVTTLGALVGDARAVPRLQMMLLAAFGLVAISLTAIGSYGVMMQLVTSRRRDIALRLAMGATPQRVGRMVLAQNARLAATGIGVGLIAAWELGRVLQPYVFGVSTQSPFGFAVVGAATLAVTVGATLVPAVRAAMTSMTSVLR